MRTRMVVFRIAGCLVLIQLIVGSAIGRPDLTGTWIRNANCSDPSTAIVGPISNVPSSLKFILHIDHNGKHMKLLVEQDGKNVKQDYVLGKNWHGITPSRLGLGGTIYRSEWKRDTLTIEKTAFFRGNYGDLRFHPEQEWILSQDGKVLAVTTTYQDQSLSRKRIKEVFDKE